MTASENQPETRGNVKTLTLESPCPILKLRAGRLRLGSRRFDFKVAERIQSSRREDGVSAVLTADGQVRLGTFYNQNCIHIGHSLGRCL